MVRLPRLGPRLAAAPTDLDDDSMERLAEFTRMTGDDKVVSTKRLLWLAVVFAGPLKLKDDEAPRPSGDVVVLSPHAVVMTPQQLVGVAKVNYYLTELDAGRTIKPAKVYEVQDGNGWWHLDGLHRLLAARILGQSLEATVYR
ncbi:hypothetical protein [Aeromicrobium fastidiosum]|uniref:ParB/Sulfiredoxin domain-containing protein n=1 Tax=Aeromicrobium fastidiosum TaxID=52699 RepID=A0A641AJC2_9ACTN|nr:hypothetical protein [Aeromicrobium fastidiosum]KAA1374832.1 hypothetical protein ESP62_015750 [Aeromicrobium fastidiosum]MBP2390611.1 hypothetical protein [Aeromicrobium fastidiosum]